MTPRALFVRVPVLAVLLVLFALVSLAGVVVAIAFLPFARFQWAARYSSRVFAVMDRATAGALPFGWDGRLTVSSECGEQLLDERLFDGVHLSPRRPACLFCKVLCRVLSWALNEPEHCENEAGGPFGESRQ